ncbi:unnamed protein product [Rotaria sordida]|uniref:TRAF1-6 MATH domain-containing protein n=1 Tax=Rotaria sordida TaxID=392033 RepID=A0A815LYR4_9BILA|nr:unnamed protein product [Rotaria sordida]CAF1417230.1 unnamed protein product [Rotaria sordida]
MEVHYLPQEHQVAIINCIRHLSNVLPDKQFENHLKMALSKLQEVFETINILTDGIHTLNNNVERLSNKLLETQDLYDQTDKKQHIFDTFQPDVIPNSCQRPHTDTNIASGIPKFIPLAIIEQENNPYVQEDSIFIKIMVDFNQIPDDLLPYVLNLDPGLPTLQQHKLIQEAINNFYQNQSITNITNTQNISQIILSS